ncbi:phosphatidate cytidylyltransferase [Hymenobacter arcticus]
MNPILLYAFGGLAGLLLLASLATAGLMRWRPAHDYTILRQRIQTWWALTALLALGLALGRPVAIVMAALVSFLALREFLSLVPTRPVDNPVLLLAYLAIPGQYLWVHLAWYGMFIIFIPVYFFLLLPVRMVIAGETKGFLQAAGTVHWGLMATVFSISHVAYLLVLPARAGAHGAVSGELLVFYLLVLSQLNDVAQFLWGKMLGGRRITPTVSPNKTLAGLLGGVGTTTLLAWALGPWLTPFGPWQAVLAGLLISLFGFFGDVVVSAIKRDVGVKDSGTLLPGHGGVLDRLDSLIYAAPLFFHYTYYLYY